MKAALLMIKSNILRRKGQSTLVGISLTLLAMLLSSSIGILVNIGQPFDTICNTLKASHIILLYDSRANNTNAFREWFNKQPEVESVGDASPYFQNEGPIFIKDKKIEAQVELTEYTPDHQRQDRIKILTGARRDQPGYGEIWLPKYLAVQHNLQPGDTLVFASHGNFYKLKITALIADPLYGSGMVNPTRAWIRAGTLPFYMPLSQTTNSSLGIRLKDAARVAGLLSRFNKQFNYSGVTLQYALFKTAFASTYQFTGSILLIFSILVLIISIFLIGSTLSKCVYDDYRIIGILKSIGHLPGAIVTIYLSQYFLIGVICIVLGLTGSYFIVHLVMKSVNDLIGGVNEEPRYFAMALSSFISLVSIILLASLHASLKMGRIKAVEAIRNNSPAKRPAPGIRGFRINKLIYSLSFMIGLKLAVVDRSKTIISFVVITFTTFIIIFSLGIISSLEALKSNKTAWGFENDDIEITRNKSGILNLSDAEFKEELTGKKAIASIIPFDYENITVFSANDQVRMNLSGKVYEGDIAVTGLSNISGRHPMAANELSLCVGTSRQLNKKAGDTIQLLLEGERMLFRVTGVYQDISQMGQGFRMVAGAVKKLNPLFEPGLYGIVLKDKDQTESFKNQLLKALGGTITINLNIEDRIRQTGVITGMKTAFLLLSFFFISILILSVWNDINILIKDCLLVFGILKAVGLTPRQLRACILWKTALLTAAAIGCGSLVGFCLGPLLMNSLTSSLGLNQFPLSADYPVVLFATTVFIVLILSVTWLSSSNVSKISPRQLLVNN